MNTRIEPRLNFLVAASQQTLLKNGLKGLEKESLRVTPSGRIAQTPHPKGLGSALKHPYITTDNSEALIELITPPFPNPADTLEFLDSIHRFVYGQLDEEALWAASMPCDIDGEDSIPIAYFGESNSERMKHVYRRGLAWRYGRPMQSIAGVHFNYSVNQALWPVLQDLLEHRACIGSFIAEQYFGMIRNVQRNGWLVLYLFGSSPAFCKSFLTGREEFDKATLYKPYATSLRMSDIGYRNDSQAGLDISLNNLDEYVSSLVKAIKTPYPAYETIGVKVDGEYRQLSTNILQISNEYYSPVRPKQIARSCESPTIALKRRGIHYIELRSLDLGISQPLGLTPNEMRVLELFLLCCLLRDSPPLFAAEKAEISQNALDVACRGRAPDLALQRDGKSVTLSVGATELAEDMRAVAEVLDGGEPEPLYLDSLKPLLRAIDDTADTPSAHVLAEMRANGESFQDYALRVSQQHAENFRLRPSGGDKAVQFRLEAEASLAAQQRIEEADTISFEEFLEHYFSRVE
ncbi:MAG: glutamate--cysteine ligase [Candidatus Methylumidiphilus sp.]